MPIEVYNLKCYNQQWSDRIWSTTTKNTLFDLPEYERAFTRFVYRAIHELMGRKDPILGQMKSIRLPDVPVFRNTVPSGEIIDNKPILVQSPFSFSVSDAISGNTDSLLLAIDDAAADGVRTIMPHFFELVGRLSDATGNTVNAKGRPVSHDLLLEVIEKMEIEFEDDGKPSMPTLVVNPEMGDALRRLPPRTAEQEQRYQDLIERKRQEYYDRKRHRKLS